MIFWKSPARREAGEYQTFGGLLTWHGRGSRGRSHGKRGRVETRYESWYAIYTRRKVRRDNELDTRGKQQMETGKQGGKQSRKEEEKRVKCETNVSGETRECAEGSRLKLCLSIAFEKVWATNKDLSMFPGRRLHPTRTLRKKAPVVAMIRSSFCFA